MKKILLVASLLFYSQTIFAQLEKGMIAVGLTSGINSTKIVNETNSPSPSFGSNNTQKNKSYSIAPTISYFLTNRFAVGLAVGYAGYTNITENTNNYFSRNETDFGYTKTTSNGTSISPYVKYYFPLNNHFNFLLKGGVVTTFSTGNTSGYQEKTLYDASGNVTTVTRSSEYGPNKTNTVNMTIGISPGILFMPGEKIGLEFSLGNVVAYTSNIAKTTNNIGGGTSKSTTSGLQLFNFNTISIGTGIYYFF